MANYKKIFSAVFQKTPKLPKKSLNQYKRNSIDSLINSVHEMIIREKRD